MNGAVVAIPPKHVEEFRKEFGSDPYLRHERSYKDAVWRVMAALLAPATTERADFGDLIGDVFREAMPNLEALGLSAQDRAFVEAAELGPGHFRGAMANLAGRALGPGAVLPVAAPRCRAGTWRTHGRGIPATRRARRRAGGTSGPFPRRPLRGQPGAGAEGWLRAELAAVQRSRSRSLRWSSAPSTRPGTRSTPPGL
jgi:hypothetical protein